MNRIALIAVPALLSACAGTLHAAPDQALTKWTFVSIDGKAPVSDKAELSIYRDRIGATVGCNGMGGDLEVVPGRLKVGPVVSTQMYCEGLMEQERAVAELLGASPAFFIEGNRMAIHSDKHIAELVKKRED